MIGQYGGKCFAICTELHSKRWHQRALSRTRSTQFVPSHCGNGLVEFKPNEKGDLIAY